MALPAELTALLRAIVAAPADDTPRLVYADWLDENDDPTQAAFIRDSLSSAADERTGELDAVAEAHHRRWLAEIGLVEATAKYDRGFPWKVFCDGVQPLLASADALARFVPLTGLEVLASAGRAFQDRTLRVFAALPVLARLSELWLVEHDECRPEAWAALFESPRLHGLTFLSLAGCGTGEIEAESLAASPALAGLTGLDLSYNSIGAGGLRAILESPHLTKLKDLWLENNFFGGDDDEDEVLDELEERLGDGLHTHGSPEDDE